MSNDKDVFDGKILEKMIGTFDGLLTEGQALCQKRGNW
jgi:hypothetical protein